MSLLHSLTTTPTACAHHCARQPRGLPLATACRPAAAAAHRGQPVAAGAAKKETGAGGGGGGGVGTPNKVAFRLPDGTCVVLNRPTQGHFDRTLKSIPGAVGFRTAEGAITDKLYCLPEGAEVEVELAVIPPLNPFALMSKMVAELEARQADARRGNVRVCGLALANIARSENPGATITALPLAASYKDVGGQEYVNIDFGCLAADTLYLGEFQDPLSVESVGCLLTKRAKIRRALESGTSPDLSAALDSVKKVKLFLGGNAVQPRLDEDILRMTAAQMGVGVLLPTGARLGFLGGAPPPYQQLWR